jgi:serine/threonine protein kinase
MATPATTVQEYCTIIVKSKLLPQEEVDSQYKQWKAERPGTDDRVDSFRRFLIARKCLTEYQAALLQRGRADGFFLSGYKILDRVGKGQMGGVYKAVHALGQIVALKILPASRAKNTHVLGRFQREARLLTQLDHPNVVRAYQVGETNGVHFIVMEFLEGETLSDVLERRKQLPVNEAVRLLRQALDGLQHLHDKRMVHRDLKPANIMLIPEPAKGKPDTTWDATVKILDIGLGRELFADDSPEGQIDTQLTQEGSVLGTPDYLAPEQAKDARNSDIRADIYSLGCVLYHLVTGRTPFPETNIMAQMLKHATEKAPPVSQFVPGVPAGFQNVIDKFLAKTAETRFQTPVEASEALKPFASEGAAAIATKMVPAYKDWLESESAMEMPKEFLQQPVKPAITPAPVAPKPASAKPGTASAPALKATQPPKPAVPRPAMPAPAIPAPAMPAPAIPAPASFPMNRNDDVDVELIPEPAAAIPAMAPLPAVLPAAPVAIPAPMPERPLWQLDRRDWMMLSGGAMGVLAALGIGYGLARALRRKPEPEPEDQS